MLDQLATVPKQRLGPGEYQTDFEGISTPGVDGWKLEVRQNFQEVGNASWKASTRGRWRESVRLMEAERNELGPLLRLPPFPFYRVRVVQLPLTPYLEWELRSLAIRSELGESIRILDATRDNSSMNLPEIVGVGNIAAYEVIYTDEGVVDGARKITEAEVVPILRREIEQLYERSVNIADFISDNLTSIDTLELCSSRSIDAPPISA